MPYTLVSSTIVITETIEESLNMAMKSLVTGGMTTPGSASRSTGKSRKPLSWLAYGTSKKSCAIGLARCLQP